MLRVMGKLALAGLCAFGAIQQPASADVGFLFPSSFRVEEGRPLTAIASFSDRFPSVEHPLRSQDFHILDAQGERLAFDDIALHDQLTVLTAKLKAPGVYRLSSGQRLGRKGEASLVEGEFVRLGRDGIDPSTLPEGAARLTLQTETVSEVFVASGDAALPLTLTTSGRLSLRVEAESPDGFRLGSDISVTAVFDDKPLPKTSIMLVSAFDAYTDRGEGLLMMSDSLGKTTLTPDRPGPHVVFIRHMAEAPADAETDIRSYTTAVVFEVRR